VVRVRPRRQLLRSLRECRRDECPTVPIAARVRRDGDVEVVPAQQREAGLGDPHRVAVEPAVRERHPGRLVDRLDSVGLGRGLGHPAHQAARVVQLVGPDSYDAQR
jgi:hypothetical protein